MTRVISYTLWYFDSQYHSNSPSRLLIEIYAIQGSRCIIDKLVGGHHHSHDDDDGEEKDPSEGNKTTQTKTIDTSKSDDSNRLGFRTQRTRSIDMSGSIDGESLSNSSDVEGEVMSEQQLKDDFVNIMDVLGDSDWGGTNIDQLMLPCAHHHKAPKKHVADLKTMAEEMKKFEQKKEDKQLCIEAGVPVEAVNNHKDFQDLDQEIEEREARNRIARMSFKTAIAVALHNFPEGLATFVAALSDPSLGAILAIAIAIHNIPEGLAVSLPMYYATGNRTKAFFYGAMSGMTEILAALLGWLILGGSISNNAYGILFGMVAGMMVIISVRELLPTAHRYDTDDQYVTYAFVTGMGAIAMSFILFNLF